MKTYNIFTNEADSIPSGKADFLLATSVIKTCEIEFINPVLDAEFIVTQNSFSMPDLANISDKIPIPVLITRAVHNLNYFSTIEILDLGLEIKPEQTMLHNFDINPSESITDGANINAKDIFLKGMEFGINYELKGSYLILGESTSCGVATAVATALALGFDCKYDTKNKIIKTALSLLHDEMSNFEKLGIVSDNMLIFCAGFILEATRRFHVVLAGATQMAVCLLVADRLREDVLRRVNSDNLTLATTSWAINDKNSNTKHILEQLSYTPHAVYTDFTFADANIEILKKYDEKEVTDGVGAGAAFAYASKNSFTNKEVLDSIELIMYSM